MSWMGWGMYLGFGWDMGLSLWDVRFRGERIIYQVRCCWLRITNAEDVVDMSLPSFHLKKPFLNTVRPASLWNCRYVLTDCTIAGNDPAQATTAWLDRHFGMGTHVRNMIPYYDCPQEAIYLPATTYSPLGTVVVERAICIFEQDTGKPLSRHFGYQEGEFGAVKSYVLTVRSTSTVGK